jgi:hypothetical protein
MKKVINGALYNTETARLIGTYSNGGTWRDFSHFEENLYRTKAGKYFLHGEGGPMTKYAKSVGNNEWSGGEHIEPLTPAAAREWAEEHLTAEEYIKEFGEPEEASDDKVPLNLTILASTKAKLEKMKSETGKSISAIIDELVNNL